VDVIADQSPGLNCGDAGSPDSLYVSPKFIFVHGRNAIHPHDWPDQTDRFGMLPRSAASIIAAAMVPW
jgi:hypothetical protein